MSNSLLLMTNVQTSLIIKFQKGKRRQKVNHCSCIANESCNKINYEFNYEKFMILTIHMAESFIMQKKTHTQSAYDYKKIMVIKIHMVIPNKRPNGY